MLFLITCTVLLITPFRANGLTGGKYCETHPGVKEFCAYENGVCCDDNKHCCPEGTICDVAGSRCIVVNGDSFSPKALTQHTQPSDMRNHSFVKMTDSLRSEGHTICPDMKAVCPGDTTCCQFGSDSWGCCDLPNAVCCPDNLHCCPHGYRCSDAQSGCVPEGRQSSFLDKFVSLLSRMPKLRAAHDRNSNTPSMSYEFELCDDKRHECPRGTSCCPTNTGSFACCPMPDAVCCSDGIHCCPKDTVCDMAAARCVGASMALNVTRIKPKTSVIPVVVPYEEQLCPDEQSRCPNNQTCCLLKDGNWGCCPVPEAVCCNDGEHCCPKGFKCNFDRGVCIRNSDSLPSLSLSSRDTVQTTCPDPEWQCKNGTTCCPLANEEWGCCSLPNAVCCGDQAHCCPAGYTCDVDKNRCTKDAAASVSLSGIQTRLTRLRCTDKGYSCPEHTLCDRNTGECVPDTRGEIAWFKKIPARRNDAQLVTEGMIQCPDDESQCPEGSTCCQLEGGTWACCPMENAVCCSDHIHCCPHGSQCDIRTGVCKLSADIRKPPAATATIVPSKLRIQGANNTQSVVCPGGDFQCPTDTTCCEFLGGLWGCCAAKNAVCCTDHMHCCPEGYECALGEASCVLKSGDTPKATADTSSVLKNKGDTLCSDKRSYCVDQQTCCLLIDGDFGCCPLANGSCCSDRMHCCPEGTMCADVPGECVRPSRSGLRSIRFSAQRMTPVSQSQQPSALPALFHRPRLPGHVIRTGWCSECRKDEFCCPDARGVDNRMCCPKAGSMCCEDGLHCCPPGTQCTGNGMCETITEDRFLAPYLIASKRVQMKSPSVQSRMSLLDPRLLLKDFRGFKSVRWTICPDRMRACHLDEQCCLSDKHGYVCAPKTANCCASSANSYCPAGSHCSADGAFCAGA